MSETEHSSSNSRTGLTATITGLLVSISALFTADLSTEAKTIIPVIAGIASPFIAAGISRLQRKVEQAPELTDYLTAYENDLKYQKKALKDKNLSADVRADLEKRYSNTVLKMATAHQDFRSETLGITTRAITDPVE
jgi:nitrogen fixation/metabolism regulation signal transduction histidine kinase